MPSNTFHFIGGTVGGGFGGKVDTLTEPLCILGAMARLARCPNIVSKLSGLGTFIHRNDAAHIAAVLDDTVAIFGAERCLFGSNFPIEKLWTSYRGLIDAYRAATARLRPEQREAIFAGTARRVYRLGP